MSSLEKPIGQHLLKFGRFSPFVDFVIYTTKFQHGLIFLQNSFPQFLEQIPRETWGRALSERALR